MSSKKQPTKIHAFLERHKIIFEVFAAICLGAASIWVGWLQTGIAEKQNQISERQVQPVFFIATQQKWDKERSVFGENELLIHNFGGPARELRCEVGVYLNATIFAEINASPEEVAIPVLNYLNNRYRTQNDAVGLLIKVSSHENNYKISNLQKELSEIANDSGFIFSEYITVFVRLEYIDLLDQKHIDYYQVEAVHGGRRISDEEGAKWVGNDFPIKNMKMNEYIDIDRTTSKEAWLLITNKLSKPRR